MTKGRKRVRGTVRSDLAEATKQVQKLTPHIATRRHHWEQQQGQGSEERRTPRPEATTQPPTSPRASPRERGAAGATEHEPTRNEARQTPARQATINISVFQFFQSEHPAPLANEQPPFS